MNPGPRKEAEGISPAVYFKHFKLQNCHRVPVAEPLHWGTGCEEHHRWEGQHQQATQLQTDNPPVAWQPAASQACPLKKEKKK